MHIREDNSSAWKLGGGIAGTLEGCPVLAFGVGLGGLAFAQILKPDMSRFRIFRFDGAGDTWGGEFKEYSLALQGWKAGSPSRWQLFPTGPQPWQLPVEDKPVVTDGGILAFSYTRGSESGGYGESLYLDEMATGQRQFWGRTVAALPGNVYLPTTVVGYLTQPLHRRLGYIKKVANDIRWEQALGIFNFIRPLDTGFNRFQVVRGREIRNNRWDGEHGDNFEGAYFSREGSAYEIDSSTNSCAYAGEWDNPGIWVKEA